MTIHSLDDARLLRDVARAKEALDSLDVPPPELMFPKSLFLVELEKSVRAEYVNLFEGK